MPVIAAGTKPRGPYGEVMRGSGAGTGRRSPDWKPLLGSGPRQAPRETEGQGRLP